MKKFFMKLLDIKVISVILAILLWYYVAGVQGPTIARTFKVEVIPINVEAGVVIKSKTDYVNVTAEGPGKAILGIKAQDFSALINLSGKTQGEYYVKVDVTPPLSGITIKNVSPEKAKVSLEKLSTITMPISVMFKGSSKNGFLPGTPIITPDKASITAPESILNNISRAFVEVDLEEINSETTLTLPVKISGKDGKPIQNVQVNPINCVVKIPESTASVSKIVPVAPDLSGSVFQGFGIKSVSVKPSVVTIVGDFKTISEINSVNTKRIDVSNITKPVTIQTSLIVNEGIKIIEGNKCEVNIDVAPIISKKITLTVVVKKDEEKTVTISPETIDLIISGFEDALSHIDGASLSAVVDATGMDNGTYELPVTINGIPKNTVISIEKPNFITVTISSASSS